MRTSLLPLLLLALPAVSCSSDAIDDLLDPPGDAEWVDTAMAAMSETIPDAANDYDFSEPPYSQPVDYAPADVVSVQFGTDGDFFYLYVALDGTIPLQPYDMPASGEVEAQTVTGQSFSIVVDTDNDDVTGAGARNFNGDGGLQGADIFFGFSLSYGGPADVYAHWDFAGNDIHYPSGQVTGELGAGGPGHAFFLARYDVSAIDSFYWPAGSTVELGGWSEAESDLYHEFVNDFLTTGDWTIPSPQ